MDQPANTITSEEADGRKWIGRIIMAVILGEAIWSLIVSVMNNLVVPWLGDVMGPSSGVPTSFSQRPYDYPDLFVSVLELGIAGLVAAVLNYFFERPRAAGRVKPVKRIIPTAAVESARVVPPAAPAVVPHQATMTRAALPLAPEPVAAPPVSKPDPVTPPAPVGVAPEPPAPSTPSVTPAPVARPLAVVPATPPVAPNSVAAKPLPPAPKAEPAKPKKPKEVYYNIVGEPMPSDED